MPCTGFRGKSEKKQGFPDPPRQPWEKGGAPAGRGLTHPVEDIGPALHGDALVHGEHGEAEVVEVGDAVVGPRPAAPAFAAIDGARAA